MCEWINNEDNTYNWKRVAGVFSQSDILPKRDHTTNTESGYYTYIETKGRNASSTSTMFGPSFKSDSSFACTMRFYFYMYGNSVGKLRVLTRFANGGGYSEKWSRIGSIGQQWERFDVRIGSYLTDSKTFQVIIEAQAGTNTRDEGVIAVDDITFDTKCVPAIDPLPTIVTTTRKPACGDGFKCNNNLCINKTQVCNFVADCAGGEDEKNCGQCNFETDNCGWFDNSYGDHFWNRTAAFNTFIPNDKTTGTANGSFAFYELDDSAFNGISRLVTPDLGRTGPHCEFEFYFLKKDLNEKSILLSLFLADSDNNVERLWKRDSNSLNDDWERVHVGLHSRYGGFRLYFEASHISDTFYWGLKPSLGIKNFFFYININNIFCPI
jgi:hypothetical protein